MSEHKSGPSGLARRGSVWGTVKAVGAAFVGLRKGRDMEHDSASLNPVHVIVVGLVGVFL